MDDVKTTNASIFIVVILGGLVAGRAELHAQSTSAAVMMDSDDAPWSKGVPIASREAARALFLEGNRLFRVPLFARAAESYMAALREWKHPRIYFNLALAQLNLGQEVEAHDNLELALRHGEQPLGAEQFQEATKQLKEVESHLGRIRITCSTEGAEVTLDGVALLTGPGRFESWIKAKAHEITAKKPDHLPRASRIAVAPGELKTLDMSLRKVRDAEETRWAVWKPWAVIASGAVVGLAGGGAHALSARNFDAYDKAFLELPCSRTGCMSSDIGPDMKAQLNGARLEQKLAVTGYIAGGSIIAAGAVLLYLNRPHLAEPEATSSPASRVAVVPAVSAGAIGVLLTVTH